MEILVKKIGGVDGTIFAVSVKPGDEVHHLTKKIFLDRDRKDNEDWYGYRPTGLYMFDSTDSPLDVREKLFDGAELRWKRIYFSEKRPHSDNERKAVGKGYYAVSYSDTSNFEAILLTAATTTEAKMNSHIPANPAAVRTVNAQVDPMKKGESENDQPPVVPSDKSGSFLDQKTKVFTIPPRIRQAFGAFASGLSDALIPLSTVFGPSNPAATASSGRQETDQLERQPGSSSKTGGLTSNTFESSNKDKFENFMCSLKFGDKWGMDIDAVLAGFGEAVVGPSSFIDLKTLWDYNDSKPEEGSIPEDFAFPMLAKTESVVQEKLTPIFAKLGALATHCSRKVRTAHHVSRKGGRDTSSTAIPDFTASSGRAVTVEVKPSSTDDACYDVLLQCVKRVTAFLQANHLLKKAVSIGVTPGPCFLIVATVDDSMDDEDNRVRLRIHRIDPREVLRFFKFFAEIDKPEQHFALHARVIQAVISHFLGDGYNKLFHYFGIKLIKKSSSRVYRVVIPDWELADKSFVLSDRSLGFVVKVNNDWNRFDKEINIFKRLDGTEQCYAVASGWVGKSAVTSLHNFDRQSHNDWINKLQEKATELKDESKTTWLEPPVLPSPWWSSFGYIVMREGHFITTLVDLNRVVPDADAWQNHTTVLDEGSLSPDFSALSSDTSGNKEVEYNNEDKLTFLKGAGIAKSLLIMHERNVCHCDIRRENVLYFEHLHRFALIDYDLAVDLNKPSDANSQKRCEAAKSNTVKMRRDWDQYKYCEPLQAAMGFTFDPEQKCPLQVQWTPLHDWMMLYVFGVKN